MRWRDRRPTLRPRPRFSETALPAPTSACSSPAPGATACCPPPTWAPPRPPSTALPGRDRRPGPPAARRPARLLRAPGQSSTDPAFRRLDGDQLPRLAGRRGYTAPSLHTIWTSAATNTAPRPTGVGLGRPALLPPAAAARPPTLPMAAAHLADGPRLPWPAACCLVPAGPPAGRPRAGGGARTRTGEHPVRHGRRAQVRIRARRAICAMPLHVAARVVGKLRDYGFDPAAHLPPQAPWLVANFLLEGFPPSPPTRRWPGTT